MGLVEKVGLLSSNLKDEKRGPCRFLGKPFQAEGTTGESVPAEEGVRRESQAAGHWGPLVFMEDQAGHCEDSGFSWGEMGS